MSDQQAELQAFVARFESTLAPGFAEVLSDETRKAQRALLVLAFCLLLIALEAIRFSGDVEFIGLKFAGASTKQNVLALGIVVCGYLEVLVAVRCFSDWHLWRLKNRSGELGSTLIEQEIQSLRETIADELKSPPSEDLASHVEVELESMTLRFHPAYQFHQNLPLPMRVKALLTGTRWSFRPQKIMVSQTTAAKVARMKSLMPHFLAFYGHSKAYEKSRRAKVAIEIYFPITFGVAAVAYACLSLMKVA